LGHAPRKRDDGDLPPDRTWTGKGILAVADAQHARNGSPSDQQCRQPKPHHAVLAAASTVTDRGWVGDDRARDELVGQPVQARAQITH
jgi:hypothetical protein